MRQFGASDDRRFQQRDYEEKRHDYAKAGLLEHWIADPHQVRVTVLALEGAHYIEHGVFALNSVATSRLLDGFSVDVAGVFAAAKT